MGTAEKLDAKYSYQDYLNWPENERWEIINGVPCAMSPAPSRKHQEILKNLSFQFESFLQGKTCKMYFAPFDVRLIEEEQENERILNVVQPDLVVMCDESKLDERGCSGAPDLIVEIISFSTAVRDTKDKLELYERYGVREYWIVYPEEKMVMVFTLDEHGNYGKPMTYSSEEEIAVGVLPDLKVPLDRVFEQF